MGNLNPKPVEIEYGGKVYHCTFTLNCIDEVQERFDKSLTEITDLIMDGPKAAGNIRYLLTLLLNESEDADGELDEMEVGRHIDFRNLGYYFDKIIETMGISLPDADEDDADPEAKAGQGLTLPG